MTDWLDLYQAALLEVRPAQLRQRIDDAEKVIRQRIAELRMSDSSSREEAQALDDALRGLRVIKSRNVQPRTPPTLARRGVR